MAEETKAAVMEYEARDGQKIVLTFDTIRRYLVQGHPEYVTPSEFMYFMGVCKSQGMNPFKRDCYLIKYTKDDAAAIITAIGFYRSRAKAQADCKGWNAGIILKQNAKLEYREGTLILEDETLVGAWFEGKPAGWDAPVKWTVPLKTYLKYRNDGKLTRFWKEENQPGQIAKVAEAQGLRKCWPDEFQNIYTDAEISPDDGAQGLPEIPEQTGKEVDADFDADAHEEFDMAVAKLKAIDLKRLSEYVKFAAEYSQITVYELKQRAIEQLESFLASFQTWEKKHPVEGKPEESEKKQSKDPIRDQYINLGDKNFKAWVFDHKDYIPSLEQKYQDEIQDKWHRRIPGEPYPLAKKENVATGQPASPEPDFEPDNEPSDDNSNLDIKRPSINCSNKLVSAKRVLISFCEGGCRYRENESGEIICKDYMAYRESQEG